MKQRAVDIDQNEVHKPSVEYSPGQLSYSVARWFTPRVRATEHRRICNKAPSRRTARRRSLARLPRLPRALSMATIYEEQIPERTFSGIDGFDDVSYAQDSVYPRYMYLLYYATEYLIMHMSNPSCSPSRAQQCSRVHK